VAIQGQTANLTGVWIARFWKLMTTREISTRDELQEMFDSLDEDSSGGLDR
jgi:Ca2+-binding EF-hand superfamily protein